MKLAHIINPVKVGSSSDLYIAQPITFESLRIAKDFAKKEVEVKLLTCQYMEDREIIPEDFECCLDIERSVLDSGTFQKKKKLPYIKDIINRLYERSKGFDYLIYSNVDIGLMPHFYLSLKRYIENGYDAVAINRKTILNYTKDLKDLPLIYSKLGKSHEGIDTFVFKREVVKKFVFENSIIGTGPVGLLFCLNMIRNSDNFIWLENEDLTFHLGDNKDWVSNDQMDYINFNFRQLKKIVSSFFVFLPIGKKQKLYRETLNYCEDVLNQHDPSKKFISNYQPKRLIREISTDLLK